MQSQPNTTPPSQADESRAKASAPEHLSAWQAREQSTTARVLRVLGVALLLAGLATMFGFMHFVLTSEFSRVPRWLAYVFEGGLAGFLYLVWRAVRARLAVRELDPSSGGEG